MEVSNITILYTFYNTEEQVWLKSLKSALLLNIKIIIINDLSTSFYKDILYRSVKNLKNVEVYDVDNKMFQEGATFLGLKKVKTKYVIRMDSDDIILSLPDFDYNYDLILSSPFLCENINDFYNNKN